MRTHKRRFVRVVGFVLLGCVFFASGFIFTQTNVTRGATTTYLLANYDLDKMVERSDLIIGGEILSISDPFWDENNSSIIRREATVNVNEVFDSSDEVSDTIKILLTGGVIGNYVHDVEPSVDLNVGDDMILFLRKSSDGELNRTPSRGQRKNIKFPRSAAERCWPFFMRRGKACAFPSASERPDYAGHVSCCNSEYTAGSSGQARACR